MLQLLILFLIRKKLGLKKFEDFQFNNQKNTDDYYFFGDKSILKFDSETKNVVYSSVSLNWLLDDRCKIIKKEV